MVEIISLFSDMDIEEDFVSRKKAKKCKYLYMFFALKMESWVLKWLNTPFDKKNEILKA